jgi:hypothetical protein
VSLDVYLVPVGDRRHELYSEHDHDDAAPPAEEPAGRSSWFRRQMDRFRATLAEAEQERRRRDRGEDAPTSSGLWRAFMRRIAETIAEQRLLWQLRSQADARLVHPDGVGADDALRLMRASITRDLAKHRRWCAIDAVLAAILGPLLFFVPGPNIVAYYFLFRAIGHLLAMRGATQALKRTVWATSASAHLAAVGAALTLPRAERCARLDELSAALGLAHLTGFVERVAARPN